MSNSELLTVKEVAGLLKISTTTVYIWAKIGVLKKYKIGRLIRFKKDEVVKSLKVEGEDERQPTSNAEGKGSMAEGSKEGT